MYRALQYLRSFSRIINPAANPPPRQTTPTISRTHQGMPPDTGSVSPGTSPAVVVVWVGSVVDVVGFSSTLPSCAAARFTMTVYSFLSPFSAVQITCTGLKAWRRKRRHSRHFCPQCGQFREFEAGVFERRKKHRWRQLSPKAPCYRAFQGCLTEKWRNL